jgi:UDP-3-O-[3-hydroxymyristoyl] glucosamine N-acyltransferase
MTTQTTFVDSIRRIALPLIGMAVLSLTADPVLAANGNRNVNVNQNANVNRNVNVNQNANVNRNTNVNRNVNVNQNTNVNVNRNVNVSGGYYGPNYHSGPSVAGVVAATVVTAAVIGSVVRTLPPSCTTVYANGFAYQNCGGTYYQPQYQGSNVTYIVVNQP